MVKSTYPKGWTTWAIPSLSRFFFFLRSVRFFVVTYDYFVSFSYKRRFMDDANERRQRHIFCWSN